MTSYYFFDVLKSTMDEARSKVLAGAEDGTVIVAFRQDAGRGRRGRVWESSLGNLHLTYITYSNLPLVQAVQLSFVACVAIGEELMGVLPPTEALSYKWPNDILLNEKKVGGILLEAMSLSGKKEIAYLIGCGLNLKTYPQEVRYPATSFEKEGVYLVLEDTLRGIGSSLDRYISLWEKEGFASIRDLWKQRAAHLGQIITFECDDKIYTGKFEGINDEGLLILKSPQGRLELIAGDVLSKVEAAA
ncbi:MAG: biotin-[acetyl-CoA-carboxylase] ligase [uncultured bacterium]|nr:MAG: biotin-[acetyl-CoA-carboxylase] ligase [uncultured bacterium]OFW69757.1 MAG: biotin--[acetyl-CoA-carboxylase] ligase [Alphaproteobacteria bacterium GWC2_42_16]OFW74357.1 MAG: biotin--[acetyl-CoA-carboxylase] ligase [Alphaproteobacteria bacterium GWA2_41_27]OFW82076.1 MAG: biotin--[acetyl-CoA-carboxylase] ligase [Alphaproteobacteria bacterium RIFCSPHIGHO2_12_FULL_42_100]OFW85133.1 MAG: biotin--[acetyl-CoA-carboxylase] ligase [Alphaproteobacteria bacterium RBG_16_42_14]OFW92509.1 MAG: bi